MKRSLVAACRHCGSYRELLPLPDGRPSSVCRPCKRAQGRSEDAKMRRKAIKRPAPAAAPRAIVTVQHMPRTVSEREVAIKRAQDRARAEGIPLVKALELEGV